jgi:hypothetical protein
MHFTERKILNGQRNLNTPHANPPRKLEAKCNQCFHNVSSKYSGVDMRTPVAQEEVGTVKCVAMKPPLGCALVSTEP